LRDDPLFLVVVQFADLYVPVAIIDHGPLRDPDDPILAGGSSLVFGSAIVTVFGFDQVAVGKFVERGESFVGLEDDVSTVTPGTPVGTSSGLVGFTGEGSTSVSTVSSPNREPCLIDERLIIHGRTLEPGEREKANREETYASA
jgi:hypothetical protein